MRVAVTGAAGLVGGAVAGLLRRGHDVIGIDLLPGPEVDLPADIRDPAALRIALRDVQAVVHVAALHAPHVGSASEAEFRRTNVEGTANLIAAARAAGADRFVLTSSTSVYGHALEGQGAAAWIDETVIPRPRDIYDETKLGAEELVRASGLRTAILRMSRCFPEPRRDMAVHRLHRGIDLRDVAEAHRLALDRAAPAAPLWLVSAAPPFARSDCVALASDAAGLIAERLPRVARAFETLGWALPRSLGRVYSPALAMREIGFAPRFGVDAVLAGDCRPVPSDFA